MLEENTGKRKVVALLSGGLDSQLAVKMMQSQGFEVSAVAIKTPFCDFDCGRGCGFEIRERADTLGVNLKTVYLGDEYIEMLKNPKHGFGSGMNPCIDCRSMMFKAAKKHMDEIGADFIISGEVLGQRPMSQHGPALKTIEKESELEGYIVRPLSGALLPKTIPEENGLIKRENLGMIRGRTRRMQLQMAQEYGIENPPNAGGGCLLTDPAFAIRAKDLFAHTDNPTTNDIDLLKIGRHFRLDKTTKLIVGRNQDENNMIKALALPNDIVFYAKDHVGPNALLRGDNVENHKQITAAITLRYSDAPKETPGTIIVEKANDKSEISVIRAEEPEYLQYRV
ncbi:tRNA (5-methylaminomethyl-2-thiouridylate)-methyltransferase [Candidatus Nitrosotenuis sp. DW1]|uniref:tRNA (5-methylaminomethyl-2-thiouridylate)-methyltransferase n=1 Tax=Candidatus Nitrosotenuis sp. DW1 TaxID=2259672 RepID=UPI0015C9EAFF|nr:tRNA (5-methylaminomethyl-2-thiouridylate)-methyltransferase [Candidatus Nitrosotenuis sp. DW1]QLH08089.1 tRNA (5-methylaminomethyl-2-thiouridylate)-methyltransferase [Candidatus Nitrosotenuis sp. DW1]